MIDPRDQTTPGVDPDPFADGLLEDDPAEMVELFVWQYLQDQGVGEGLKGQFRDALTKFVDQRIAVAMRSNQNSHE